MRALRNSDTVRFGLWTVGLSTLIAAGITGFSTYHHDFGDNFVYSQSIGLVTFLVIDSLRKFVWKRGLHSPAVLFGLALAAAPIGWYGGSAIASLLLGRPLSHQGMGPNAVLGFLTLTAGCGLGGTYVFWTRKQIESSKRSAVEARLKLLQAQIEPHFLFNTLANLQALIAVDPNRAQRMLGHLDGYLRATLATTRNESGTLAEEFALLRAYLEILLIRMGPRLNFTLDLPPALANATLPPMLLQPLVENAIRHGLEPKVDGGMVKVSARAAGSELILEVEDTGLGPGASTRPGPGVGLAHVRERLAAAYGNAASVVMDEMPGGGTRVRLRLPLPH